MRIAGATSLALALVLPGVAFAQEWAEYTNRADRFSINFPGEPRIEEIEYQPLEGPTVPARIYSANRGEARFTLTLVDFTRNYEYSDWAFALSGANAVQGSIAFEAAKLRQRGEVTYDAYDRLDLIPGILLQVTEPDGRRIFAGIYLYDRRLYVMEASVPRGAAPPGIFRTSLRVLDSEGQSIRFNQNGQRTSGGPPLKEPATVPPE